MTDSNNTTFTTTDCFSTATNIAYSIHERTVYERTVDDQTGGTPSVSLSDSPSTSTELPTLVLIHGICHSRHAWEDTLPYLVNHYRVVAIDLPGHGKSPDPASLDGDIVKQMLGVLAVFLREVSADGEKPHVAGNSLGGYFSLELARQGHAASAVAFNPAGFFHSELDQKRTIAQFLVLYKIGKMSRKLLPTMAKTAAGRTFMYGMFSAKPWKLSPELVTRDALAMLENNIISAGLKAQFAFSEDTAKAPQTCYWGTVDLTLIRGWKRHYDVLPNAELHLLPGLGHVPMVDDPKQIADAIIRSARA